MTTDRAQVRSLRQERPARNTARLRRFVEGRYPWSIDTLQSSSSGLRFLIAESEPPDARRKRRESVGRSSGETYLDILARLAPGSACDRVKPADADCALPSGTALADYDAVFLSGSPLSLYEETPEVRRALAFMGAVFASGTPSFG